MLGISRQKHAKRSIACCLAEKSYSFAILKNQELTHCECRELGEKNELFAQSFASDVERLKLVGATVKVILAPGQYQLILMDALDVPPDEMAKALRWRLKGLVDYSPNDIALDIFFVPPHGAADQRRKVFIAVTSQSELKAKLEMIESSYLKISSVGIAQLALRNLLSLIPNQGNAPLLAISAEEEICQLQVIWNNNLYLTRDLPVTQTLLEEDSPQSETILLEIQRSMDYCLSELKLPEPQKIIFTPSFYKAEKLLDFLKKELLKEVILLDLSSYFPMAPPLVLKDQTHCFYSIGGAMTLQDVEEIIPL